MEDETQLKMQHNFQREMLVYEGSWQSFSESFAAAVLGAAIFQVGLQIGRFFSGLSQILTIAAFSIFSMYLLFHAAAQFYNGRNLRSEAKEYSELIDSWVADQLDENLMSIESIKEN